ncbi:MAG: SpoIVB peptidase [Lachnospiraceae bacterium]
MFRYWYRRILIMVLVFTIAVGGGYYLIDSKKQMFKKEVNAKTSGEEMVIPGGMPVGIYLETEGVMVLGTDEITGADGMKYEPSAHRVKAGDYIVGINHQKIENKDELIEAVDALENEKVVLTVRRKDEEIEIKTEAVKSEKEKYKLGIWVRDNAQGLGTITFLDANSKFGALGHGIHDVDTNELLDISEGTLYTTSIKDIQKGENGTPGGMEGIIIYNNYNIVGRITQNTDAGIFGTIDRIDTLFTDQTPVKVASKEEIEEGPATIRCAVEGKIKEYDIKITDIDYKTDEVNKGIVLEVTDPDLLKVTGGIVQGMSGSPILQNGKLVGAVTHVLVNDPTRGYGIFIENMLDAAG